MATWNSRGLRGSTLEDMVNRTNERYIEGGLALIQKIPTPITPIKIDQQTRHITLAYFEQKSTVDYIGAVQGIPVCFDAKECAVDTFSLQNIHEHQVQFMERFEKQGGVAFSSFFTPTETSCIICPFPICCGSGSAPGRGGARVFATRNWTLSFSCRKNMGYWFPTWICCSWIWKNGKKKVKA